MRFSEDMNGLAESFVHKRIIGAARGFASGGIFGAASGFATGGSGSTRERKARKLAQTLPFRSIAPCAPPNRLINGFCQKPKGGVRGRIEQFLPGGKTGFEPVFEAVSGAFGMPAMVPAVVASSRRVCPKAMVLGEDGLCYPKAILRRNSRFREWKPGARPILTGGQRNMIRKARSATNAARKAVGLSPLK